MLILIIIHTLLMALLRFQRVIPLFHQANCFSMMENVIRLLNSMVYMCRSILFGVKRVSWSEVMLCGILWIRYPVNPWTVVREMHCKQRGQMYIQGNVYFNKNKMLCLPNCKRFNIIILVPRG